MTKYLLLAAGFSITVTLLGFISIDNGSLPYNDTVLQHSDMNICVLNYSKNILKNCNQNLLINKQYST